MRYEGALYRPPSEAYSLIVQVTIGCSHNKCTFCSMYKDDDFRIRSLEEIIADFKSERKRYHHVKRVFLADGDALIIKMDKLVKILEAIKEIFPECERVGVYGSPRSVLLKSKEELLKLKSLGLGIVYIGLESGSDKVLTNIKKGVNAKDMVEAGQRVVDSGIELSITLISGIGGKADSKIHAIESAQVLNQINPNYVGLLTLLLEGGTELNADVQDGKFELLTANEVLLETKMLIEKLELENCVFRSNHASNYLALKGTLSEDKALLLHKIEEALKDGGLDKKDRYRRL